MGSVVNQHCPNYQKTFLRRVRAKYAQNEGHAKATQKPQKSPKKATSQNVTSNEKSSEMIGHMKKPTKKRIRFPGYFFNTSKGYFIISGYLR